MDLALAVPGPRRAQGRRRRSDLLAAPGAASRAWAHRVARTRPPHATTLGGSSSIVKSPILNTLRQAEVPLIAIVGHRRVARATCRSTSRASGRGRSIHRRAALERSVSQSFAPLYRANSIVGQAACRAHRRRCSADYRARLPTPRDRASMTPLRLDGVAVLTLAPQRICLPTTRCESS